MPQDTSLFDETVEYNIRYGNPNATVDEVAWAVQTCNLGPTVAKLGQGLATAVGERGEDSMGKRVKPVQRCAVRYAVFFNATRYCAL